MSQLKNYVFTFSIIAIAKEQAIEQLKMQIQNESLAELSSCYVALDLTKEDLEEFELTEREKELEDIDNEFELTESENIVNPYLLSGEELQRTEEIRKRG